MFFEESGDPFGCFFPIGAHVAPFGGDVEELSGLFPDFFGCLPCLAGNDREKLESVDAAVESGKHRAFHLFEFGAGLRIERKDIGIAADVSIGVNISPRHLRHEMSEKDHRSIFMSGRRFRYGCSGCASFQETCRQKECQMW